MTTDELVRLIEQDTARHLLPGHEPDEEHFGYPCIVTIGTLSSLAGVARRTVEHAIETARNEGTPIITDGGVRVAQTAEEARALAGWLWGRIRSQMDTAEAVEATALRWETEAAEAPTEPVQQSLELVAA